jgi:hypothetical protein
MRRCYCRSLHLVCSGSMFVMFVDPRGVCSVTDLRSRLALGERLGARRIQLYLLERLIGRYRSR